MRSAITAFTVLVLIPLVIYLGYLLSDNGSYQFVSAVVAALSCVPFFMRFENARYGAREITVISAMTAISVLGRLIFVMLPGFKPVTAIAIVTGAMLGAEAGFINGSLTALISNFFYGQGPWTPFQMLVWGLIGAVSGWIFKKRAKPNVVGMALLGVPGGVAFSLIMDVWTVISVDGTFTLSRYLVTALAGAPFAVLYAVSNVVFLLLLGRPLRTKLERLKTKYGIFR